MHQTQIIGHIGGDVKSATTSNDKNVVNFNVGVNNRQGKTDWFRVAIWGRAAEFAAKLKKGDKVWVQGQVSCEVYKEEGQLRLDAFEIQGMNAPEKKKEGQAAPANDDEDEVPF
jgi:single-stranded DNA-binding protein